MNRLWHSESGLFNLAAVGIFATIGAVVTPAVGLHLVFAYKWGALALAIPLLLGVCAFVRAMVLQQRRFDLDDAKPPVWWPRQALGRNSHEESLPQVAAAAE